MSSKGVASKGGCELVPADVHGLWPWLSIVAVPPAEACGDPCDEGERSGRVRILLLGGCAFEFARQPFERDSEVVVDDIARRARAAISGIDQLDGSDGSGERDCGEVEQSFGIDDLTVLQSKSVALERAEELLNAPTQTIEIDDLFGSAAVSIA